MALESVEISFKTNVDLSKVNSIEYCENEGLKEDKNLSSNVKE